MSRPDPGEVDGLILLAIPRQPGCRMSNLVADIGYQRGEASRRASDAMGHPRIGPALDREVERVVTRLVRAGLARRVGARVWRV